MIHFKISIENSESSISFWMFELCHDVADGFTVIIWRPFTHQPKTRMSSLMGHLSLLYHASWMNWMTQSSILTINHSHVIWSQCARRVLNSFSGVRIVQQVVRDRIQLNNLTKFLVKVVFDYQFKFITSKIIPKSKLDLAFNNVKPKDWYFVID